MHNRRLNGGLRRGTSLVEVLVVLVILVLGIFSIARLFPGGFFTIRSAENNTFADRLAQAQLETLKQNSAFLLDGVYVFNPNLPGVNGFTGGLDPGVNLADLNNDYPGGAVDPAYSDINKARYIKGELFTVPAPPANGPNVGIPTHLLNYGPVVVPLTAAGARDTGSLAYPSVYSAPWAAQTASSQNDPADLNNRQVDTPGDLLQDGKPNYLIDYANGKIAVPPTAYAQRFVFQVQTKGFAVTILLNVPARDNTNNPQPSSTAYDGGWFNPTDSTLSYATNTTTAPVTSTTAATAAAVAPPWISGTASLKRPLLAINAISTTYPTPDPYVFALPASTMVSSTVNMGVLEFDPRLVGQQMSASYLVQDWHIIHEDVDVPAITTTFGNDTSVTNAPIRLTLNHLRRVGDVLSSDTTPGGAATASVFPGLFPGATNAYDIVLLDTDTGQMQGLAATSVGSSGSISDSDNDTNPPAAGQFAVSYLNGRITLPAQNTATMISSTQAWTAVPHKHLRVFYAGDYGWAVALQKNPTLYRRDDAGLTPAANGAYTLAAREYAVDTANQAIYFPLTDIGQSVELDDVSYQDTNGKSYQTGSVTLTVSGVSSGQYPDVTDGSGHTTSGIRAAGDTSANLATALTLDSGATLKPSTIQIGAVRGISARAVVIWKERDQWKTRTVGTILNRS